MIIKFLAVAFGGAIGAVLRLAITEYVQNKVQTGFPYGTMIVNIVGAFLIGFLMVYFLDDYDLPQWTKLLFVTGCLGGLTTFSTFTYEWLLLLEQANYLGALFYGGVQLIGGLILCLGGIIIGRLVF